MPVILETISWILKNVNVGVDRLIVGYGVRFVYSVVDDNVSAFLMHYKPKICIKYRKHGSSSFSHTFNCVCLQYRGPISKSPKSCQMTAHDLKIHISIFFS